MTRIIAGEFKGRRLEVPKGRDVRPTTDRMRERLFSILAHHRYPDMDGARVADLFAGTGALGLEALSRGADHVVFVEQARPSLAALKGNITVLKAESTTKVIAGSATRLPKIDKPFEFIFMDPPYRQDLIEPTLNSLDQQGWTHADSIVICELATDETLELPASFEPLDDRKQGQQRILILGKTG
ncbi:MAG: 16S rRNA (guanine(966)-N(2))-methyltransferase RsmD [Kordiimonadaceae bacterium]|nr:16S rRNA (guanine(966)-N(2))-methyltransferase RsmD [Kordiimonadaceae bacterium]MBO6569713.1 16S rRNA (guanine(966)-N(2))-methyltransferase RsmD [Kordiimonadaceae bacterium]MBO6966248.1 16S rRNA (guanine(966)-N(2))-methyltransferase RsmD [Kordiimonadaceae bacterium]